MAEEQTKPQGQQESAIRTEGRPREGPGVPEAVVVADVRAADLGGGLAIAARVGDRGRRYRWSRSRTEANEADRRPATGGPGGGGDRPRFDAFPKSIWKS